MYRRGLIVTGISFLAASLVFPESQDHMERAHDRLSTVESQTLEEAVNGETLPPTPTSVVNTLGLEEA